MTPFARLTFSIAVVLAVAACSGGSEATPTTAPTSAPSSAPTSASTEPPAGACAPGNGSPVAQVTVAGFAFSPSTVTARVGEVVGWTNQDSAPHAVGLDANDSCRTPNLGAGDVGTLVFSEPGTYPYHCRIHPDMRGTIEIEG